jgi:hypothetical protein
MSAPIHYSDGSVIRNPVVQIWDDINREGPYWFRAFWCSSPEAESGSPVIGYCSPGGSHRTIVAVVTEVRRLHPDARIYRNGREIHSK